MEILLYYGKEMGEAGPSLNLDFDLSLEHLYS